MALGFIMYFDQYPTWSCKWLMNVFAPCRKRYMISLSVRLCRSV